MSEQKLPLAHLVIRRSEVAPRTSHPARRTSTYAIRYSLFALLILSLACSLPGLLNRPTPTPLASTPTPIPPTPTPQPLPPARQADNRPYESYGWIWNRKRENQCPC